MTARFPSRCAESDIPISKGDEIIYYPRGRKAFKVGSSPVAEKELQQFQALAYEEDHGHCTY